MKPELSLWQKLYASFNKWIGKSVDYDRAYGNQCVDWARQCCEDLGYPIGTFSGSAIEGWKTGSPFNGRPWKRVFYKFGLIPNPGDVVFFSPSSYNKYGHVAMAGSGSKLSTLNIVEQNAVTGNGSGKGGDSITQRTIKYTDRGGCVGWFTIQ